MLFLSDPRCLDHHVPRGFPERPARLEVLLEHLDPVVARSPDSDLDSAIEAVHPKAYVDRLERAVERGDGLIDSADTPLSAGTLEAARAAVSVTLAAVETAMGDSESPEAVFALVRPPGHHAERRRAMGFCYLGNAAIAAEELRRRHGIERVAIVDIDVHHGNGTQHLFEEDPDVFYASAHQFPFYPGTGAASERGVGAGEGATLNVPLAAGAGDAELIAALDEEIVPALERFEPEFLLVSAGFDAWGDDPLGGLLVTEEGFRRAGSRLGELARRRCGGRLVALLEGGYDVVALPRLVKAFAGGVSATH